MSRFQKPKSAIAIGDIALTIDFEFIKTHRRVMKAKDKRNIAVKVFTRFYEMMITDVIENNVEFQAPTRKLMLFYVAEDLPARTKRLNYHEPAIFEKKFKQHVVWMTYYANKNIRHRFVSVNKTLYKRLAELGVTHKYLEKRRYA